MHGTGYEDMVRSCSGRRCACCHDDRRQPSTYFRHHGRTNIKKLVLVAARRQAQKAEELGADAVMVVGQEGGGHLGRDDVGTMVLVPQVVDSVKIPVIASGGIGDGRGWMAAHALGAEGIEMGTRFIATKECIHASEAYKEALLASSETDTTIIKRSIGAPARAIRNAFTEEILEIERTTPTYEALKEYISGEANKRFIYDGKKDAGIGWAGQVTGMIHDIPTVDELITRMVAEAESIRLKWGQ